MLRERAKHAMELELEVYDLEHENQRLAGYAVDADAQQLGHLRELRAEEKRVIARQFAMWLRHRDVCAAFRSPEPCDPKCTCGLRLVCEGLGYDVRPRHRYGRTSGPWLGDAFTEPAPQLQWKEFAEVVPNWSSKL